MVELLIAIGIIPTVIYASSVFELYSKNILDQTYNRGMRLSDQLITFQYLERTMANGSSASVTEFTAFSTSNCPTGEWNYRLIIQLPKIDDVDQPQLIYDFKKTCADSSASLTLLNDIDRDGGQDEGEQMTTISYFGAVDYPKPTPLDTTVIIPFAYDVINNKVTVNLGFKSKDPYSPDMTVQSVVKLAGGSGGIT